MSVKVMVVDDSMMVRTQLKMALTGADFSVIEAVDGLDACNKIEIERDVRLIVLDVNMPKMGGLEFLETLRAKPANDHIAVLMLTTEGQPALLQRAKELGAKGWLIKPFKADLVISAVKKLTA